MKRECVLLKDHNAVTPVRLEPAAPRSRVKDSTTEPLRSLVVVVTMVVVSMMEVTMVVVVSMVMVTMVV